MPAVPVSVVAVPAVVVPAVAVAAVEVQQWLQSQLLSYGLVPAIGVIAVAAHRPLVPVLAVPVPVVLLLLVPAPATTFCSTRNYL